MSSGDINSTTGYRINGTAGASVTCSGGQFLQNPVVSGGIVTGGACASAAASGGVTTVGALDGGTYSANGASISGSTIYLQAATNTHVGLVTTTTQTFAGDKTFSGNVTVTGTSTLNNNVTVATGKTIRLVGDTTAQRPASPSEGTLYFDTTTKKLLVYSNGKWQADRTDAILVAASNSSQSDKDAADYITNGESGDGQTTLDGDQVEINQALTAGAGKKVVLLAGTYVADATILVPNNTTLMGVGQGTVIELADIDVTDNLIENSDTTTGTGVTIQDLKLDGRKDINTAGTPHGIHFSNMGGGTGSTARQGAKLTNTIVTRFKSYGIYLVTSSNNTITGNTSQGNDTYGIFLNSSSNNTITGNTTQGNASEGIILSSSSNNTITGNTSQGNSAYGIYLVTSSNNNTVTGNTTQGNGIGIALYSSSNNNTITGNIAQGNTSEGIRIGSSSNYNTVTGNSAQGNTYSIHLSNSNNNIVGSNAVFGNGLSTTNNAIYIETSDNNTITGNTITDASATTTNYAINITDSTSDTNYLANNTLGGGSINDAGTGTIYAGQQDSNGYFGFKATTTRLGLGNVSPAYTLDVTGDINTTTGYRINGTAGASVTCSGGQFLQNPVVSGGIVTGGSCVGGGGGGVSVVGALDGGTYSANGASISGSTIYLQAATNTHVGLVTTTDQTFAGNKTFSGTIQVGDATNNMTLSSDFSVTGRIFKGNGRPTKRIMLTAEYSGSVLDAGSGANNTGTMISGVNVTDRMNYYKWTTTQATNQDYDVVVQVPIPKDFDGFTSTNPVRISTYSSDLTNGTVQMEMRDSSNTVILNFVSVTPSATNTWQVKDPGTVTGRILPEIP